MTQEEKYNALRGYIRATKLAARRIGGNFMVPLKDQLAKEAFGITFTEAHSKGICIRCRKVPDFPTEADKKEYDTTALCHECWDHLFGEPA
jgi:hypothetical protein